MSDVDRQAAACLLPSFPGLVVPEWVERWLERGLGGITLFAYNVRDPEQLAQLTAALRAERPELLISIDEEGGDVTRLEARARQLVPRQPRARRRRRRRADGGGRERDRG